MSDASKDSQTKVRWLEIFTLIFVALEIGSCALIFFFVSEKQLSIVLSRVVISIIIAGFILYLFGIVRDREERVFLVALVFIFSNITAITLLFANIYKWLGLKDTLRPDLPCPSPLCLAACHDNACPLTSIWDAIYFSLITWTTVGYGDITPTLDARSTAAFEAITGYVVMGLVVSVLIILAKPYSD